MRMRTTASCSPNGKEQGGTRLMQQATAKTTSGFPYSKPFAALLLAVWNGMHAFSVFSFLFCFSYFLFFLFVFLQLFPPFSEQMAKAVPFIKTGRPLLYREMLDYRVLSLDGQARNRV